jgi:predicted aspartyl protease
LGNEVVFTAILDSGSEVNLISQEIYEKLTKASTDIPVLPVENIVLVTAFGRRSNRIRIQAYVEFTIGADRFEQVFLVSSQLKNDVIIGCQFLKEFGVCIDFYKGAIS